ncbi:hypothetical protein PHMEG_00023602 [Phytophthora megakarya]|uniref:Uncharacterized protein n=1 Tax=Phytophthora megakarya TaxID=4795 RepID=A0A225VGM5_9STRA|nr:hypothetical protein PHMEG_00023602 [Phytophthora megakarya]
MREQAPDDAKCLIFADFLAGSAKNCFQIVCCGLGVLVARQYYHTRRRSDESPRDYLYRLNVARLRGRLKIKDDSAMIDVNMWTSRHSGITI